MEMYKMSVLRYAKRVFLIMSLLRRHADEPNEEADALAVTVNFKQTICLRLP